MCEWQQKLHRSAVGTAQKNQTILGNHIIKFQT